MEVKYLCKDPLILELDNFLSTNECDELIKLSKKHLEDSSINFAQKDKDYRRSNSINIKNDKLENKIRDKLNEIQETDCLVCSEVQITKYRIGGFYKDHFDAFLDQQEFGEKQRHITSIIYLNDSFDGGETTFSRLNLSIPPKMGKLVIFKNCIGQTNYIHPNSLHSSEKVTRGEKYIATLWYTSNSMTQDNP